MASFLNFFTAKINKTMKHPPQPCPPFTPCWCETRPNNPNCKPSLPIDDGISVLFVLAIFIGMLRLRNN